MGKTLVDGPAISRRSALVAAVTVLTVTACGDDDGDRDNANTGPEEVIIGVSLELTGIGAAMGVLQERALQITADNINVDGVQVGNRRRPVRLVIRDNASNARNATAVARELIEQEGVHALIGGTLAETSLATVNVAQEQQVPMISLAGADEIVLPLSRRTFIYKVTPDAADVARLLARELVRQERSRTVLLAVAGPYGNAGVRAVEGALATEDRQLARTVRFPTSGGFRAEAQRALEAQPDAVVVWATAPNSGAAARALRSAGYDGPIFFDSGAVAEETLSDENAEAVEGAYVVHPSGLNPSSLTNTTTAGLARRDFVFRYIQLHGSYSGFAPYASDAFTLLTTATRLAKSVDRGRIRAYLETMAVEGIAGAYAFTPISHGGMEADSLALFTVSRGSWVRT